jgi:hypothetical protein
MERIAANGMGLKDVLFGVEWAEWLDRTLRGRAECEKWKGKPLFPRRDAGTDR